MSFSRVLRHLCIASGALVVVAGVIAGVVDSRHRKPACRVVPDRSPNRRDSFAITKSRGNDTQPKWVLQGFGRFQCFLLFDSWQEAMDQATFRLESLTQANGIVVLNP